MYTLAKPSGVLPPIPKDTFEKGRMFEEYVTTLFNDQKFNIKEWRKASREYKSLSGLDLAYPDLELVYLGKKDFNFAVECKWRADFTNGSINWAKELNICAYLDFEKKYGVPVFIAIGVGGHPSAPDRLFVTPLRNICNYTWVHESQLIPYKRKADRRFFYDTVQTKLF